MSDFSSATAAALRVLQIHSATAFSWFGVEDYDSRATRLSPAGQEASLLERLQARLYSDFYVHGEPRPTSAKQLAPSDASQAEFFERLRAANATDRSHQSGWTVADVKGSRVIVEQEGLRLWLAPNWIIDAPPRRVGEVVTLQMYGEQQRASPGFYVALGAKEVRPSTDMLTRVYWNVSGGVAPRLIGAVTHRLNEAGIPFRLKVANRPDRFDRADAGVLYLPTRLWQSAATVLEEVHRAIGPMRRGTPAYTKELANGVAVAEDPGDGASFGTQRCRILAMAALRTANLTNLAARVEQIEGYFAEHGVNAVYPWLRPGSADIYAPWDPDAACN